MPNCAGRVSSGCSSWPALILLVFLLLVHTRTPFPHTNLQGGGGEAGFFSGETMFYYMDRNQDGWVEKSEFRIAILNIYKYVRTRTCINFWTHQRNLRVSVSFIWVSFSVAFFFFFFIFSACAVL